jgi:ABC-2 type transport system ATP-binding protein
MIQLKEITKKYSDFAAVERLNLSVEKGEVFGFLGPNGAGKTTTIKMMGGVLQPTSGTVTIAGINMQNQPINRRRLKAKSVLFPTGLISMKN